MHRRAFASVVVCISLGCAASCDATSTDVDDDDAAVDAAVDAGNSDTNAADTRPDFDEIPCGPRRALQTTCQQCHTRPPQRGAPFALVHRSDLFVWRDTVLVRDLMIGQLETRRMPLTPVAMDEEARATLLAWLRKGAPSIPSTRCVDSGADTDADTTTPDAATETGPFSDAETDAAVDATL